MLSISCCLGMFVRFFFTGNLHFAYVEVGDETTSRYARYACYLKNSVLDVKYPGSYTRLFVSRGSLHELLALLWSPYVIGQTIIFLPGDFCLSSSSSFFPRLISAAVDWMSIILPHMVWP